MNIAIILSGGSGVRLGSEIPKQYIRINNKCIIEYSLEKFCTNSLIDAVIIVCTEDWSLLIDNIIKKQTVNKPILKAEAGPTRQYSILNGLIKAETSFGLENNIVIIHDAARPLVSTQLIKDCIDKCDQYDGVMPAIPVKDTIYRSSDGKNIESLLKREELWCGQAPEAFRFAPYMKAHQEISHEDLLKINGSTELAFKNGLHCTIIEGDPMNFKITTSEDLINFENIVKKHEGI